MGAMSHEGSCCHELGPIPLLTAFLFHLPVPTQSCTPFLFLIIILFKIKLAHTVLGFIMVSSRTICFC